MSLVDHRVSQPGVKQKVATQRCTGTTQMKPTGSFRRDAATVSLKVESGEPSQRPREGEKNWTSRCVVCQSVPVTEAALPSVKLPLPRAETGLRMWVTRAQCQVHYAPKSRHGPSPSAHTRRAVCAVRARDLTVRYTHLAAEDLRQRAAGMPAEQRYRSNGTSWGGGTATLLGNHRLALSVTAGLKKVKRPEMQASTPDGPGHKPGRQVRFQWRMMGELSSSPLT